MLSYAGKQMLSTLNPDQHEIFDLASSRGNITMEKNDCLGLCKFIQGTGWPMLARHLGLQDGWIESTMEKCKNFPPSEAPYQMLVEWLQANGNKATIGALAEAMKTCSCLTTDWIKGLRLLLADKGVLEDEHM